MNAMVMSTTEIVDYTSKARLNLADPGDSADFIFRLMNCIGSRYNLETNEKIRLDVTAWLMWMLIAGKRPDQTKRTQNVHGYQTTQRALCAALEPYWTELDMANTDHFWLLERATRPLNKTARHPADVAYVKQLLTGADA